MSKQVALDNIALKPTSRWGHTEYSLEYHVPTNIPDDMMDKYFEALLSRLTR